MGNWKESLEALESDDTLTVEQYEEWLKAGDGKFYDFHRNYLIAIGHAEEQERIIKLLETEIERFEHEDFYAVGVTNGLIELIKGETNV